MSKRIAICVTVVLLPLPVSAQATTLTMSGTVVNMCVLTVATPGALAMSANGTSLSTDETGGVSDTLTVVASGSSPSIQFGAPTATGPAVSVSGATKEIGYTSTAGASQAYTSTSYLPPAPTRSGGEDSIETSSGTRCRQSINSSGPYADFGVTGTAGTPDRRDQPVFRDDRAQEATAYARLTVPIGPRPKRIDCSQVFELEIAKLKREVELLRMGVH